MVILGNLMTGYRYRRVKVKIEIAGEEIRVRAALPPGLATLDIALDTSDGGELPNGSPFPDWRTARQFAGPMPYTFSPREDGSFTVIEGSRADWVPRPVAVRSWMVGMFDEPPFRGVEPVLANAFMVENIDYRWERGRVVKPRAGP